MTEQTQITKTRKTRTTKALTKPITFDEFVLWMSTFESIRDPKTQEEFAKKFKVSEQTLSAWKKRDDFWNAVEAEWKKWGREKTTNIMQKLYTKIMQEGESSNFKLWFQYFLDWVEKQETKVRFEKLEEISVMIRAIIEKKYDEQNGDEGDKGTGEVKIQEPKGGTIPTH
jgi:DNA-binding transcriptional regulator YiaG